MKIYEGMKRTLLCDPDDQLSFLSLLNPIELIST